MDLSHTERIHLESRDMIMAYRAIDDEGESVFAYIKCNRQGVTAMKKDFSNGCKRDPAAYGIVIYQARTADPDEDAISFLQHFTTIYNKIDYLLTNLHPCFRA